LNNQLLFTVRLQTHGIEN